MARRQARVLGRLTEICMDIAEALRVQVLERTAEAVAEKPSGAGAVCRDPELAISRIARAVRLNLMLEARLAQERQAGAEAAKAAARTLDLVRQHWVEPRRGQLRRDKVLDVVEQTIEAEAYEGGDGRDVENLLGEVYARVKAYAEVEYVACSIGEMVACVCEDMGLSPDWSVWAGEDWAIAEAAAKTEGSPFGTPWPEAEGGSDKAGADPP